MLAEFFALPAWNYAFGGNTIKDYLRAVIFFLLFLLLFHLLQRLALHRFQKVADKTKSRIDDTILKIVAKVKPPFYSFLAFYFALQFLEIHPFLAKVFEAIMLVWVIYLAIASVQILVNFIVGRRMGKEREREAKTAMLAVSKVIKIVLWSLGFLLVLSNLGFNINSLITGLGIGGIAVAFALQNILSDLFSSFAIYFDKPFMVGDFIEVGKEKGTVEKIGIKTTRLRSLNGEEVVISNRELTSAEIHNFKKLKKRRVSFILDIDYQTSTNKLRKVSRIIKEIIQKKELARFERVHLAQFGDSGLRFEVVYYVDTAHYKKYMDINEQILLKIKEALEKAQIKIAYPTKKVFFQNKYEKHN